jgi:hypothetical protein
MPNDGDGVQMATGSNAHIEDEVMREDDGTLTSSAATAETESSPSAHGPSHRQSELRILVEAAILSSRDRGMGDALSLNTFATKPRASSDISDRDCDAIMPSAELFPDIAVSPFDAQAATDDDAVQDAPSPAAMSLRASEPCTPARLQLAVHSSPASPSPDNARRIPTSPAQQSTHSPGAFALWADHPSSTRVVEGSRNAQSGLSRKRLRPAENLATVPCAAATPLAVDDDDDERPSRRFRSTGAEVNSPSPQSVEPAVSEVASVFRSASRKRYQRYRSSSAEELGSVSWTEHCNTSFAQLRQRYPTLWHDALVLPSLDELTEPLLYSDDPLYMILVVRGWGASLQRLGADTFPVVEFEASARDAETLEHVERIQPDGSLVNIFSNVDSAQPIRCAHRLRYPPRVPLCTSDLACPLWDAYMRKQADCLSAQGSDSNVVNGVWSRISHILRGGMLQYLDKEGQSELGSVPRTYTVASCGAPQNRIPQQQPQAHGPWHLTPFQVEAHDFGSCNYRAPHYELRLTGAKDANSQAVPTAQAHAPQPAFWIVPVPEQRNVKLFLRTMAEQPEIQQLLGASKVYSPRNVQQVPLRSLEPLLEAGVHFILGQQLPDDLVLMQPGVIHSMLTPAGCTRLSHNWASPASFVRSVQRCLDGEEGERGCQWLRVLSEKPLLMLTRAFSRAVGPVSDHTSDRLSALLRGYPSELCALRLMLLDVQRSAPHSTGDVAYRREIQTAASRLLLAPSRPASRGDSSLAAVELITSVDARVAHDKLPELTDALDICRRSGSNQFYPPGYRRHESLPFRHSVPLQTLTMGDQPATAAYRDCPSIQVINTRSSRRHRAADDIHACYVCEVYFDDADTLAFHKRSSEHLRNSSPQPVPYGREGAQLHVGQSRLPWAGNGLFAGEFIPRGSLFTWYIGQSFVRRDDLVKHMRTHSFGWDYVMHVEDSHTFLYYIDGMTSTGPTCPAASINHSVLNCNVAFQGCIRSQALKGHAIGVATLRDIHPGQEIFADYGGEYVERKKTCGQPMKDLLIPNPPNPHGTRVEWIRPNIV